jgi:hypothetical protein
MFSLRGLRHTKYGRPYAIEERHIPEVTRSVLMAYREIVNP